MMLLLYCSFFYRWLYDDDIQQYLWTQQVCNTFQTSLVSALWVTFFVFASQLLYTSRRWRLSLFTQGNFRGNILKFNIITFFIFEGILLWAHQIAPTCSVYNFPILAAALIIRVSSWLIGNHGSVLNWFKSCLSFRSFRFKCDNQFSLSHACLCVVLFSVLYCSSYILHSVPRVHFFH